MIPSQNATSGVFPMMGVAALSVVLLIGAALWQGTVSNRISAVPEATTTPDITAVDTALDDASSTLPLTPLGVTVLSKLALAYDDLNTKGTYTAESGAAAAKDLAPSIRPEVSSHTYVATDVTTTPDSSRIRIQAYRSDLQNALKPLMENKSYELSIYAHYIATADPADLALLQQEALNYHAAVLNAAHMTVPESALTVHLGILNSLDAFGSTIATQVQSAKDPYASAALLSAYNSAETQVFLSFQQLALYFRAKIPS